MRKAFINTLIQLAETDSNLYLLTADMGFGLVEPFAEKFPKQYINVGVAEQNMIGVATGLALEGKKVFCYSIGNFPTMRCLEQIRNDVCYHNLPVCIVSGGAGLWYGNLGMTHWAVEDIAVMRCLPNMAVVSPSSPSNTIELVNLAYEDSKPYYLRMSRPSTTTLHLEQDSLQGSGDVRMLAIGGKMIENALEASQKLQSLGIAAYVFDITEVKPLDLPLLGLEDDKIIVTIEEHSRIGGLGSAVAEVLAGMKQHPPLVRLGTKDEYPATAMSYEELLKYHHLDTNSIVSTVVEHFNA
jgi:transketolase